jgi:hypothetical protein
MPFRQGRPDINCSPIPTRAIKWSEIEEPRYIRREYITKNRRVCAEKD